jgi:hypothetical protein
MNVQIAELRAAVDAGSVAPNPDQQAKLASEAEVRARVHQLVAAGANP